MYTYVNNFSLLLGVVVETEHTENLPQACCMQCN